MSTTSASAAARLHAANAAAAGGLLFGVRQSASTVKSGGRYTPWSSASAKVEKAPRDSSERPSGPSRRSPRRASERSTRSGSMNWRRPARGRDRNLMRPVKLTAKNALFAGHDEGAHAWGRIASLIATCKLNGVEPYAWLKGTLEKIAAGHPQSRVHEPLPWAYSATSN